MTEFDLETTIRELSAAVDGAVFSRSRVIDSLLDLRLDAAARADVIGLVDEVLADVPGKHTVSTEWWREQLEMFELLAINPVEPVS